MPVRIPRADSRLAEPAALALMLAAALGAMGEACRYRHQTSDLVQDYASGLSLRTGGPIYTPLSERVVLPNVGGPDENPVVVNDHPPTYVLFLTPLTLVPYPSAFLLLAAANVLTTIAGSIVIARDLGWRRRRGFLLAAGVLSHPGVSACVSVGNVSLVLLGLVVPGWRAIRRGHGTEAGI